MAPNLAASAPTLRRFGKWCISDPVQKTLILLLVAEASAPLAVMILQPGFDKGAGPLDLDFDFVVQMAWCFVVLWLVGFVASWNYRMIKKRYLIVHFVSSPLFLFLVIVGISSYRK